MKVIFLRLFGKYSSQNHIWIINPQAIPSNNYLSVDFPTKCCQFCCCIQCQVYVAALFPFIFTELM